MFIPANISVMVSQWAVHSMCCTQHVLCTKDMLLYLLVTHQTQCSVKLLQPCTALVPYTGIPKEVFCCVDQVSGRSVTKTSLKNRLFRKGIGEKKKRLSVKLAFSLSFVTTTFNYISNGKKQTNQPTFS